MESLHNITCDYTQLITAMTIYTKKMEQFKVNTKVHKLIPTRMMFSPRDDPIACLNKAIFYLTPVASQGPPRPFPRNAIVQGKYYNDRKRVLLNATTAKVKDIWLAGQILDEEQLAFLADLGNSIARQAPNIHYPPNAAIIAHMILRLMIMNMMSLDCTAVSLMANISKYGSDVINIDKIVFY
ncbi:hypothetical protein Tco_0052329 [Tanacetum coccineum]